MTRMKLDILTRTVAIAFFAFAIVPASADEDTGRKATVLVDKAIITLENFVADPNQKSFRHHLKEAKGIFIVPMLIKGGFIFGASGGNGVLLGRGEETGEWSYPVFYTMGSVNVGIQIGAEVAEVVLLLRSMHDVATLHATSFKFGADISVAAGLAGAGTAVKTADILVYSRNKGAFVGLTLEGAVIEPRVEWNQAYYGKPARPEDILIRRNVSNKQADALRMALDGTIHELKALETGKIDVATPATTQ